ncbi:MAG: nitrate reductase catalytic subunit [Acidobacteria bacterium RIFCSPLOWO2_02_FULL_64_15]|nr:MAG: nitrate reductase catalytic subunit [Acidobacteria bacterium RIFCSPLOWO2_02_FULL_64_15]
MDTNDQKSESGLGRRDLLKVLGGVAVANGLGASTWAALELLVPSATADTWHKSVCRYCGTGCGVLVGMRDGRVTDVRGDDLAHNKGVICVKGSMLRALPYVKGRLTTPKIRRDGRLVDATWDEAMSHVAQTFKDAIAAGGPDSVAFYGSGQLLTEESYTANKLFKAGIRTNNVDGNPRLCMGSAAAGYTQVYGKDEPPGSYEDIDYADCIFTIGANLFECHPPLFERVQQRRRASKGTRLIVVDPRRTRTAEHADIHLAPVPGTDLLLLNAMAQVICEEGLLDTSFIDKHVRFSDGQNTVDLAAFKAFLEKYKPEAVASELGIAAHQIREVAFLFARSRATTSLWTMGINQRTQGVFLNNMLNGLHLITGHIGRPGATPFSVTGQPNACGGVRDTGALGHLLPAGHVVANEGHRRKVEQLWGVEPGTISDKPGLDAVSLFRAMGDGRVKAALVMCTNPAQSLPAADRYRAAMEKCFLVVAEIVEDSETAQFADVLLPAALWIEKEGVTGQGERRYQLIEKLMDPPGQARSDLDILVDLADRLGHGALINARTPEDIWDEWRQFSVSSMYNFKGMTRARLEKERGLQWPCPSEDHPGTIRRYVAGDDPLVTTTGSAMEFYGQPDKKAVVFLRPYVPSPEHTTEEFPFYLTTGRVLEQWHTSTMTGRIEELARASGDAVIEINDQDAWKLQIAEGDSVEVRSRFGTLQGRARLASSPRRGVVFATFHDTKLLINRVVADHVDPVSKEPEFKVTAVSLRKAVA